MVSTLWVWNYLREPWKLPIINASVGTVNKVCLDSHKVMTLQTPWRTRWVLRPVAPSPAKLGMRVKGQTVVQAAWVPPFHVTAPYKRGDLGSYINSLQAQPPSVKCAKSLQLLPEDVCEDQIKQGDWNILHKYQLPYSLLTRPPRLKQGVIQINYLNSCPWF